MVKHKSFLLQLKLITSSHLRSRQRDLFITFIFAETGYFKTVTMSPLNFPQGKQAQLFAMLSTPAAFLWFLLTEPHFSGSEVPKTTVPQPRLHRAHKLLLANLQHSCLYILMSCLLSHPSVRNICWFVSILLALGTRQTTTWVANLARTKPLISFGKFQLNSTKKFHSSCLHYWNPLTSKPVRETGFK